VPREGLPAIIHNLNEWLPRHAQGDTFLPIHVVRMELCLCYFPDDVFHIYGFLSQVTLVIKLDVGTQVNAVLCHG